MQAGAGEGIILMRLAVGSIGQSKSTLVKALQSMIRVALEGDDEQGDREGIL